MLLLLWMWMWRYVLWPGWITGRSGIQMLLLLLLRCLLLLLLLTRHLEREVAERVGRSGLAIRPPSERVVRHAA